VSTPCLHKGLRQVVEVSSARGQPVAVDWLADYVDASSNPAEIRRVAAQFDAAILAATPEVAGDPGLVADLHASTLAQFRTFVGLLQRDQPELLLPPQAVDLALSIARRQMPLGVLLKVYRVAERAVWDYFKQIIADFPENDPRRTGILVFLWDRGRTWIDGSIEQLIQVFYQEEQAGPHGMLARRAEAVHAVLRGDPTSVDAATQDLGYQLSSTHLGLVFWADHDAKVRDPVASINATAASLALRLGAPKPLLLSVGRREVWGWLALPNTADLRVMSEVVRQRGRGESVRIACGLPSRGVAGFQQSHREALDTQRLVIDSGSTQRFTSYADVELVCLVAAKPESVSALVARELRGLAGSDPALAKIRETVRRYLARGANVDMTASDLIVHKNTVRYRLAQAEELIGHPLTERRAHVEVALRYLEWHPAS
jgi:hypothetical protein